LQCPRGDVSRTPAANRLGANCDDGGAEDPGIIGIGLGLDLDFENAFADLLACAGDKATDDAFFRCR
jgi:hypothetical protein